MIMTFDPGGITGVAWFLPDGGKSAFTSAELTGTFEQQATHIDGMLAGWEPEIIVYETYTITQRTAQLSQQHEALMLIGMIRYCATRYPGAKVYPQSPAQAKSFSSDSKLKAVGYWNKTPGGHANDAARHLLRFQAAHGLLDAATLDLLESA